MDQSQQKRAVEFGRNLRLFRQSRPGEPSIDDFYKNFGYSKATGSRWESGETDPDRSFLEQLFEKYGDEAAHLMPGGQRQPRHRWLIEESRPSYGGMAPGEAAQRASSILREVKAGAPHLREILSDEDWDFLLGGVTQILAAVPKPEVADSLRRLLLLVASSSKAKKAPAGGGEAG